MSRSTRNTTTWGQIHKIWLKPVLVLAAATALFLGASFGYDWYFNYQAQGDVRLGPIELLFNYDMETLQNVLGNLAQTVVAVVGIVITVVTHTYIWTTRI